MANSSLILAILIYMGWAYDDALYGYFHLDPLDLGFGPLEYSLRSLNLFSPDIVIAAVVLIAMMSVRTWGGPGAVITAITHASALGPRRRRPSASSAAGHGDGDRPLVVSAELSARKDQAERLTGRPRTTRSMLIGAGVVLTITALALAWSATHIRISTFLLLGLLGGGPLLLTQCHLA